MVEPTTINLHEKVSSHKSNDQLAVDTSSAESVQLTSSNKDKEFNKSSRPIGKTPDGETFEVPETHDMVRSLFDPTLRKSYAEIIIGLCLASNFLIYRWLDTKENRIYGFVALYTFWRLAYNFGIGVVLYYQSNYTSLTKFAKDHGLFKSSTNSKTLLQKLAQLELKSKMGKSYDIEAFPDEFNTWLLFRQFVDLVLMQDFTTYMFLVYTAGTDNWLSQSTFLNSTRLILGSLLVGFNLWVKLDAHKVVKDFAWYWGDFFFLEEAELVFTGSYNLAPHPMYSIGYLGYYGFALITKSYLILIVSLAAHFLQFVFLTYVENPHMDKIYGSESFDDTIGELESHESYLKPLIVFGNFNPIRITDYLTILAAAYTIVAPLTIHTFDELWTRIFFIGALVIKLTQSFGMGFILHKQSVNKWWTKLYLKHGLDNVAAFSNWQSVYNLSLVLSYSSLFGVAAREILNGQHYQGTWLLLRFILGGLLVLLQIWTSRSIFQSIGTFGWFYGDFFLPKLSNRNLTNSGIYRYLNDPERLLGISGIWGLTLITYSPLVFILAMLWTAHVTLFITFVEKPHMIKVYGEQQVLKNVSGVSLTIKQMMPERVNNTIDSLYNRTFNKFDDYLKKKRSQSESVSHRNALRPIIQQQQHPSLTSDYKVEITNLDIDSTIEVGKPLEVTWRAPKYHSKKDWIGLYNVISSGSSRKKTSIPSSGRWVAINKEGYDRPVGIISEGSEIDKESLLGAVQFSGNLLSFEKGVYELRYHASSSHSVLAISQPFEIVVPPLNVNSSNFTESLFNLIQRVEPSIKSITEPLNFKNTSPGLISQLASDSTNIDIAPDFVLKLKTVSNIAERIKKSKRILDELNSDL
ncbi:putative membrane protein [Wickerhamomyces ciferrii]|uniref:Phosphatidylethanolamine N-methyltransferase n=1 Tax=Wickerhamomyces ciferrii (strain ATCC 14091 / BCRC 22168 / CBS 111 / JCM 3599 / NBRC 0793 / NRRL Y-1031 F-60-10) TaxID=1206466 RepID=K0KRC3_WICCF|nr:uncharacterized protein BN7_5286 [Wickerhamomyces ciferrii]CCH45701.1 putative membrane protein [Wickerhamomyces ciferrii]